MRPYLPEVQNFINDADFLTANADDVNRITAARHVLDTADDEVALLETNIAKDSSLSDSGKVEARERGVAAIVAKHERTAAQMRGCVNDVTARADKLGSDLFNFKPSDPVLAQECRAFVAGLDRQGRLDLTRKALDGIGTAENRELLMALVSAPAVFGLVEEANRPQIREALAKAASPAQFSLYQNLTKLAEVGDSAWTITDGHLVKLKGGQRR